MNARFNPIIVLLFFSAFTLFSCTQDNKSSKKKSPLRVEAESPVVREVTPVTSICSGADCLTSLSWKIFLQGQTFPDKVLVKIDGNLMIDECLEKQKYSVKRGYNPEFIYLDDYKVPSTKKVKVDIYDLGPDCNHESLFLSQEEDFIVNKTETSSTLEIYL